MNKVIYILRHAHSISNQKNIFQGNKIDTGLSDIGIKQQKIVFKYFKNINLDTVYISESKRSFQTIEYLIMKRNIKLKKTHLLNEVGWGKIEGKKKDGIYKIDYNKIIEYWKMNDLEFTINNSEKLLLIKTRINNFIVDKIINTKSDKILIVSHSRIIKFLLIFLFNERLENIDKYTHKNIYLYKIYLFKNKPYMLKSKLLK